MTTEIKKTDYLSLLPEIFQEKEVANLVKIIEDHFGDFEKKLDHISDYFNPLETPKDFLPWFASWVALVFRTDWTQDQQRKVLAQIIPLYRKRGTRDGLQEYLKIYVGDGVTIRDEFGPFQVGVSSQIGVNTYLGGRPHFFLVTIAFDTPNQDELKKKAQSVEEVLVIEKPAHTFYKLEFSGPTFQVGKRSTIGTDTII